MSTSRSGIRAQVRDAVDHGPQALEYVLHVFVHVVIWVQAEVVHGGLPQITRPGRRGMAIALCSAEALSSDSKTPRGVIAAGGSLAEACAARSTLPLTVSCSRPCSGCFSNPGRSAPAGCFRARW